MSLPRVSIGLPFVKDANLFADAIRSVFAQTFSDWELILVDDGATEECLSVAQSLQDPRVLFVRDDCRNRGQAYRRNQIARIARGEYIAVMDADDVMHPERLARQVQYLDSRPDVHAVGSDTYIINKKNQVVKKRTALCMGASLAAVLKGRHVLHPTITARAEWFRQNPYDPAFRRCEDRELWCRTCTTSVFGHIPEPLFFYRQGDVNVQNYINSYRADHELVRRYGGSSLGFVSSACRILLFRLKILAYQACGFVNAQSVLAHWYSEPLSQHESLSAARILGDILRMPFPGSLSFEQEESADSAEQEAMSR
ncbi:MAG TPA: glycosyltransferase [Gemmataceae bacterium]|jgi:glycosyltransferase involved in cell wall biosynthesis